MFFDKNSKAHELIDRTIQNLKRDLVSHYKHEEPVWSSLSEPLNYQNSSPSTYKRTLVFTKKKWSPRKS